MIRFEILNGKMAGARYGVRRFPLRIGRAPQSGLQLEDAGVWETHAEVYFERGIGFHVKARGEATLRVNGEPVTATLLRPGDVIDLGAARMRFWLGEPAQHKLGFREYSTWAFVAAIILGQIALIYRLL